MNDKKRIQETAAAMISAMEKPINGIPSIKVLHRANAERFARLVIEGLWEVVQAATQQEIQRRTEGK